MERYRNLFVKILHTKRPDFTCMYSMYPVSSWILRPRLLQDCFPAQPTSDGWLPGDSSFAEGQGGKVFVFCNEFPSAACIPPIFHDIIIDITSIIEEMNVACFCCGSLSLSSFWTVFADTWAFHDRQVALSAVSDVMVAAKDVVFLGGSVASAAYLKKSGSLTYYHTHEKETWPNLIQQEITFAHHARYLWMFCESMPSINFFAVWMLCVFVTCKGVKAGVGW